MKTHIHSGSMTRLVSRRRSLWRLPGVCVFLSLAVSAIAGIRNGFFTNDAAGWTATGGGAGAPRVATSGSMIVVRIGTNATAGVPGTSWGRFRQTDFSNGPTGVTGNVCVVTFTATFNQAPGETAKVTLGSELGSNSRQIPAGGPMTQSISLDKSCLLGNTIDFTVESATPGAPINSLLEITAVSSQCATQAADTMAPIADGYDDPPERMVPEPLNMGVTGTGFVLLQPGYTPLALSYQNGSNLLDNVVHAFDNSQVIKWDASGDAFVTYTRIAGHFQPPGGTLQPGDAAFFFNPSNTQAFTYFGTNAPLPLNSHPSSGSNFFGNSLPGSAAISDVIGTRVIPGDTVIFFQNASSSFLTPSWTYPVNAVTEQNLPLVPAGGVVEVRYAAPGSVPLSATVGTGFGSRGVTIRSTGGLPPGGLLQQVDNLGDPWRSLYGVAGFYQDPLDASQRFFRADYSPPTNQINLHVIAADGVTPIAGAIFQEDPNGTIRTTDTNGNASFSDVALGQTKINSFFDVFTEINLETNQESQTVPFVVTVDTNLTQIPVNIVVDPDPSKPVVFVVGITNCTCAPWAGVVGGTINGIQKVVAGGGVSPKGCIDLGTAHVTITGPGGINVDLGSGGRQTFDPAANGTWTVTATVCGLTKTATITLP